MAIKEPRKFVPTDQGHADVLNIPITTLYENDQALAAQVESIRSDPAGNGVVPKEAFDQYKQETQAQINTAMQTAKDYTNTYAAPKQHSHPASDLPSASTQVRGIVQLNTSTSSPAIDQAATPSAVKAAMDRANEAFQSASNGKNAVAAAITGKGVPASGSDTFAQLSEKIGAIQTTSYGVIDINRVETSPTWVNVGKRFVPICQLPAGIKILSFRVTGNPVHRIGPNVNYNDGSGGSWNRIVLRNVGGSPYITLVDPYLGRITDSVVLSFQFEYGTNMGYSVFRNFNSDDGAYYTDKTIAWSDGVVDLTAPTELCFYNQVFGSIESMPMNCNIVGRLYYA